MFAFVQVMAVCPVRSMRAKHGVRGLNRDFPGISPGLSQRKKPRWARHIQRTQRGFKVYGDQSYFGGLRALGGESMSACQASMSGGRGGAIDPGVARCSRASAIQASARRSASRRSPACD